MAEPGKHSSGLDGREKSLTKTPGFLAALSFIKTIDGLV